MFKPAYFDHTKLLTLWFWLIPGLLVANGSAQEYLVSVQHYSVPEGLSNRYVQKAMQDRRGFIWVATKSGLHRFDGFEFRQYPPEKYGFRSNEYEHVYQDRQGRLWLVAPMPLSAEGKMIDLFDPHTGVTTPFEQAYQAPFSLQESFDYIQADPAGNFYFLLRDGRVYRYDGKLFKLLLTNLSRETSNLVVSSNNLIGLISRGQVIQFDSLGNILHQTPLPEACDFMRAGPGGFWVGRNKPGDGPTLWAIRAGQAPQPLYFRDESGHTVYTDWEISFSKPVFPDWEGRWWVCTGPRLLLFGPEGQFLYDISSHIKEYSFTYPILIFFDRRQTAWISTSNGLFSVSIKKNPFTNYLQTEDLADTRGIIQDENGRSYIVQNGEVWLNPGATATTGLNLPAWGTAARDAQGALWFGDYSPKVHYFNPDSGEKKVYAPAATVGKFMEHGIRAFYPDSLSGRLWAGLEKGGLAYIDKEKSAIVPFTGYAKFPEIRQASVHCFLKDEAGIWMGTNQGLYLLGPRNEIVARYSRKNSSLPYDNIFHIHKDRDGIFWLATSGGGLIRWDPDKGAGRQFTTEDGLSNNVVYAVYEDEFNHLWLPSNYGLMRFDKQSFQVNTYLPRDGIPYEEFNFSSHYQAADGRLFFGGLKGVTAFYPRDLYLEKPEDSPAPGIGRYLELDGVSGAFVDKTPELLAANHIRLAPRNKSFLLEIVFPDYQSPKDNRFAYRLEGLHEDWIYQPDHTIRANGLPYGSFTLHVKAQGASGRWAANELSLPLTVLRPFYLRPWFAALCFLLAASLVWWRIRALKQAAARLETEVKKRTLQIEQDKQLIENQAAELRQLDELKSRFFTNMAHELRTPLTLIISPLKKLLQEPGLESRFSATLKLIQSNAEGLRRLAEEILDLNKLEARRLALIESTSSLHTLTRRIMASFESHAQAKGIDLQFDYRAAPSLQLEIDINKFERIVYNLVGNALKFTPRGGKVTVTVTDAGDHIRMDVIDTGRGIHPDDLPYIFDRFYQTRRLDGKAEGGAGIGLALAREYAQLMGGSLRVESRLDKGSAFVFEFPKKEAPGVQDRPEDDHEHEAASATPGANSLTDEPSTTNASAHGRQRVHDSHSAGQCPSILIVEDNSDLRSFLEEILSPVYEVIPAENGVRALELLNGLPAGPDRVPELILTDLMMPEMDGYSLIEALKADVRWRGIPIVVLTARAGLTDRLTALRIGVDDYLAKPFETEELLARAANLIRNYRTRLEWRRKQAAESGSRPGEMEPFPQLEQLLESEEIVSADQQWLTFVEQVAFQQVGPVGFSAEDLARELVLSPRQLRRKLRQLTGMGPNDYLREIRLQKARQLLENQAFSTTSEVCYAIGLSDLKYFAKIFRERFGKNPSDYASAN